MPRSDIDSDGTYTAQTTVKPQRDPGFTPPSMPPKHGTWVSNGADIAFSGLGTASNVGGRQMLLMGKVVVSVRLTITALFIRRTS